MASSVVSLWMTNGVFIKQGNDIYFLAYFKTYISNRPIDGRSFYFLKIVLGKILEGRF